MGLGDIHTHQSEKLENWELGFEQNKNTIFSHKYIILNSSLIFFFVRGGSYQIRTSVLVIYKQLINLFKILECKCMGSYVVFI